MYFFLPDEREGLQNLLEKLISDFGFSYEYRCLGQTRLDKFWIPKFKFSYDFDVSLTMKEMGMSFPFMENSEDFAEMVEIHKNLPFTGSQMIQKAFIEVDEKGTVATAITAFRCFSKCAKGKRPESTSFVADHPFIFMIMEERSRLVILTGAFVKFSIDSVFFLYGPSSMWREKSRSRMELCTRMTKQLLLKEAEKGNCENLVLSPLSIDVVLNMVAAGSKGPTLEKMLGWLGAKNIEEIKSQSLEMMAVAAGDQYLEKGEEEPVLCLVNGAWFDQRFTPKPSYKEDVLKGIYGVEAKTVDFMTRGEETEDEINLWAEAASRGLIKKILPRGSLSREMVLILANGLYFKGKWEQDLKFDADLTENRPFYLLNGDTVSVPFMTSRKSYRRSRSFDGFQVLHIPYQSKSKRFSMYFFLPDERDGLQNLLEKLISDSGYSQEYYRLSNRKLDEFWIPKFKFSYDFDISLTMKEMGMSFPFMENPEDFVEMVEIPKILPFIGSKMIQKAFIEVDEKGTVASAITRHGPTAGCSMYHRPENTSFVADHPFMFMIIEERSRLVIFTGVVLDPSKGK
ncbi:hypothetical protein RHGRI_020494 [Rhododendron griersonianum]|uniref:Serpin domain-containing protein n=1 Tax=Rhododendron griersonianum TaxID=479676 RepID=A0AAV6JGE8_9ERIC|nr:hypothetical protein RHGRI_020494 [Rhododendron griersonianum]